MAETELGGARRLEAHRDAFTISTDPARLDLDLIHGYLTRSYWAAGIPRDLVERSLRQSLNFGVYEARKQMGFARVVTDLATFAYLADVFVLEPYRGRGLSKWLLETILAHPDLQDVRRWHLVTRDAQGLYARFGFAEPPAGRHMERVRPNPYGSGPR
jgi:N-acetylglutamate synthase-like GNAT family acetyltransferase